MKKQLVALGFIALLGVAAIGAPAGKPAVPAAPAAKGREIQITSDKLDYDEAKKKVRLIGSVKIVSDKMTMTAPYAEFFTDKKMGEFQGGVKMTGPGSVGTGRTMKVWYNEKKALLKGDVRLVTEKGAGATPGSPTVMTCDELEYFWEKGQGKARGRVRVRQSNRRAFGDRAIYDKNEQIVILEGNVRFERAQEDWLTAERARMDLANETITAEGGVVARTRMEEQPKEKAQEQPKSQARPQPLEPDFPIKPVEAEPEIKLPGLDR